MSSYIIKDLELSRLNVGFMECKNKQYFSSISIFYYIDNDGFFSIKYNFHKTDFYIWLKILKIHKKGCKNSTLFDINNNEIKTIHNNENNYIFILKSKDYKLYQNIYYIFFFENVKNNWNNLNEMLLLNTIENMS